VAPLREPSRWPLAAVQAGAGLFMGALVISAVFEPAVWVLHTLQALIYVAVIALARRNPKLRPWAQFLGGAVLAVSALALIRLPYIDNLPHPLDIRRRPDPRVPKRQGTGSLNTGG